MSKHTKQSTQFAGTEAELVAMTSDLDQMHHDIGVPAMEAGVAEMIERMGDDAIPMRNSPSDLSHGSRCGCGWGRRAAHRRRRSRPGRGGHEIAALAQQGQRCDVPTRQSQGRPRRGGCGSQPGKSGGLRLQRGTHRGHGRQTRHRAPAVATFATTAKAQHTQHAAAWNGVLTGAGKQKVTVTNPTLTPTVQSDFAKVTDVTGLAQLALTLETIAAQTYQAETAKLKSSAAIGLSSSIQPVEMQHIAILYYVLGEYPGSQSSSGTPLAFNPTNQAA